MKLEMKVVLFVNKDKLIVKKIIELLRENCLNLKQHETVAYNDL
ncbi:MAG: hypothetical protein ACP5IT_11280 [Thermoproteota archaeon]